MLNIFSMSLKSSKSSHPDDCDSSCASYAENEIPNPGDCNSDCSYTCTDSETEGIGGGGGGEGEGSCWVCTGTCLQQCADYSYMSSK